MSDEQQIRDLIESVEAGMRDQDVRAVLARYTPDVVKYDLAPPLASSGAEAISAEGLKAWWATFDGPVTYEVHDLVVTIGGDVAFAHSLNRMSAVPVGTDFRFEMWCRATYGLARVDGAWQISHEHTSTPFYMDGSLKAAVDLKP